MAYFKWVGQANYIEPTRQDNVVEFRVMLRGPGKTCHFPIDPVAGFAVGEFFRAPGVTDPNDTTPFSFTTEDYRLEQLQLDPRIVEATP